MENYIWENEIKESYPLRQLVNDLRKYFDNGEKFIFSEIGVRFIGLKTKELKNEIKISTISFFIFIIILFLV